MPKFNMPIYREVWQLLKDRGWETDEHGGVSGNGDLREFVHPERRIRMTWVEAILAQREREILR
jgi:hypothetical protein